MVCRVDNTIGNLINRKIIFQGDFFSLFLFAFPGSRRLVGSFIRSSFFFRSSESCCFICCFSSFACLFALLRAAVCLFNVGTHILRIRMSSRACLRIPRFVEVSNCRRSFFLIAEVSFVSSSEDICEQFSSEEDSAGCFG